MSDLMIEGKFITLEGPDGSGKSTIISMLKEDLDQLDVEYIITREPGGIHISEQIREIILDKENTSMDKRTEALLYAASRRQHLIERILPALRENKVVICDRFVDSSLAYQGSARNIGIEEVFQINHFAIEGHMPDLTIYFDIPAEVGLDRIMANENREINRLDLESLNFHKKVCEGYKKIIKKDRNRFRVIDATKSIEEVYKAVFNNIKKELNLLE